MKISAPSDRSKMSGGLKAWVMVFASMAIATYLGFFSIGPHYQAKWRLQDQMGELMGLYPRYAKNSSDPEYDMLVDLQKYIHDNRLGFDALEETGNGVRKCYVRAEILKHGEFGCDYDVMINILGVRRTMHMQARYSMDHVPATSF